MKRGQSKEGARRAFLRKWGGLEVLPGEHQDVTPIGDAALAEVLIAMRRAGLYAPSSPDRQCRWGIRRLVTRLRP